MTDATHLYASHYPPRPAGNAHRWDASGLSFVLMRCVMAASALMIGVIGALFGRMLRVYYLEPSGLSLDAAGMNLRPLFDFCFSYMMCKVFGATFGNSFPMAGRFRVTGVWLTVVLMHNVVWWYPEWMAALYSPAYVEEVQDRTEPGTIYAVAAYVSFSDIFQTDEAGSSEGPERVTPDFFLSAEEGLRLKGFRDTLDQTGREGRFIMVD